MKSLIVILLSGPVFAITTPVRVAPPIRIAPVRVAPVHVTPPAPPKAPPPAPMPPPPMPPPPHIEPVQPKPVSRPAPIVRQSNNTMLPWMLFYFATRPAQHHQEKPDCQKLEKEEDRKKCEDLKK